MSDIPSSGGHWIEPRASSAATPFTILAPYKTTAGYWVWLAFGTTPPAGATAGALVSGTYDTLLTSTTVGLRVIKLSSTLLFR